MSDELTTVPDPQPPSGIYYPISSLDDILIACDPGEALTPDDVRYVDLNAARYGIGIAKFQRTLTKRAPGRGYHHGLLCGHRGSGKSTELLSLQQWANANGFLAIWQQVDAQFGMIDLDYSDVFLLAAAMTESVMRANGFPLPDEQIRNVVNWFKEVIREDSEEFKSEIGVEVGGQLGGKLPLGLGNLFAKLTAGFKGTSSHAMKIRDTMRCYPVGLIAATTDLLQTANAIMRVNGRPNGLLLLFDNMDRYDPVQIDKVLVRSNHQMLNMACHAVFTFPISLLFNPISGRVTADYKLHVTLPMIALRGRNEDWGPTVAETAFDETAIATLRHLLAERINIKALFVQPDDVDYLIKMSGGVIRDLIQLVANAATYTESEDQITTEAVQQAVQDLRGDYMRLMATHPHDYACLARIARRKLMAPDEKDYGQELNRMLFNSCLLEYTQDEQPWFDAHPTLIETEEFRDAHAACS